MEGFLKFLLMADGLKTAERWEGLSNWGSIGKEGNLEMVSDHSWKLSILAISVIKQFNLSNIDIGKVVQLAIVHDLPEALTGDISTRYIDNGKISREEKRVGEENAMEKMLSMVGLGTKEYINSLWMEYEEGKTIEAKLVKSLDKLDALLHFVNHSDLSNDSTIGGPEHFASYGNKNFEQTPYLKDLVNQVKDLMKKKYYSYKLEWKDEYDVKWDE